MEIIEMKNTITEIQNQLEGSLAEWIWQKKDSDLEDRMIERKQTERKKKKTSKILETMKDSAFPAAASQKERKKRMQVRDSPRPNR